MDVDDKYKKKKVSICDQFINIMVICNLVLLLLTFLIYIYYSNTNKSNDNNNINQSLTPSTLSTLSSSSSTTTNIKCAIIVTLVGNYLKEYFEWSCRTIQLSSNKYDMLIFHEDNQLLNKVSCGTNVKFINLGKNGFANIIVREIYRDMLGNRLIDPPIIKTMIDLVSKVIEKIPRYMVEIKPISGSLFSNYLKEYSHWSYTDADILWGNLNNWLNIDDLINYDIITVAKLHDAGRLFMRGQFALHQNIDKTNLLWKKLDYFSTSSFSSRMEGALTLLKEDKHSIDSIYEKYFHSAEGFYSKIVFDSKVNIKVIGLGFDDFNFMPVILKNGHLIRCPFNNVNNCIESSLNTSLTKYILSNNMKNNKLIHAYHNHKICHMNWLPKSLRFCLAHGTNENLQLIRIGESFSLNGSWYINTDNNYHIMKSTHDNAAFFHFRHWDDYGSSGLLTKWSNDGDIDKICMVLYIRSNNIMTFEPCLEAFIRDEFSTNNNIKKSFALKQHQDNHHDKNNFKHNITKNHHHKRKRKRDQKNKNNH